VFIGYAEGSLEDIIYLCGGLCRKTAAVFNVGKG